MFLTNFYDYAKYYLVGWPEIQDFMEHPRWDECVFCEEIEGHPCGDSTYAVPVDLYEEVYSQSPLISSYYGTYCY